MLSDPAQGPREDGQAFAEGERLADSERPVVSSNTPPSIHSHSEISQASVGGEDWLELALYVKQDDSNRLWTHLDFLREMADSGGRLVGEMKLENRSVAVRQHGASAGDGAKRLHFRWVIDIEPGIVLLLMRRSLPHETMPNAILRITSIAFLRRGTADAVRLGFSVLSELRIVLLRSKVSRVDPCVDLVDVPVESFSKAYAEGRFVTRCRTSADFIDDIAYQGYRVGRTSTGFSFGRGATVMRVYDKIREVVRNPEKLELLRIRRLGGEIRPTTRIEFQLRRERLKRLGVDGLEDWFRKRASIVKYLTDDWIRFVESVPDAKNPQRAGIDPVWTQVQERFAEWAGKDEVPLVPLDVTPVKIRQLLGQLRGLLVTGVAMGKGKVADLGEVLDASDRLMLDAMHSLPEEEIIALVNRKALRLGRLSP